MQKIEFFTSYNLGRLEDDAQERIEELNKEDYRVEDSELETQTHYEEDTFYVLKLVFQKIPTIQGLKKQEDL